MLFRSNEEGIDSMSMCTGFKLREGKLPRKAKGDLKDLKSKVKDVASDAISSNGNDKEKLASTILSGCRSEVRKADLGCDFNVGVVVADPKLPHEDGVFFDTKNDVEHLYICLSHKSCHVMVMIGLVADK